MTFCLCQTDLKLGKCLTCHFCSCSFNFSLLAGWLAASVASDNTAERPRGTIQRAIQVLFTVSCFLFNHNTLISMADDG